MHIGIIGAGFAGLSHAKVLREFGFDVTVFDKTPDVGGVWSRTRRYPGLTTPWPRRPDTDRRRTETTLMVTRRRCRG